MADTAGSLVLVTRLSRAIYRQAAEASLGLSLKDYMALRHLKHEPGITQRELGGVMHLDANNCVILLNGLEDRGQARRVRDPDDRRRHRVEITGEGLEALDHADAAIDALEDELLGGLSQAERTALRELLDRALTALPAEA